MQVESIGGAYPERSHIISPGGRDPSIPKVEAMTHIISGQTAGKPLTGRATAGGDRLGMLFSPGGTPKNV